MSAKISRQSLSRDQVANIARLLVMKPKQKYVPSSSFYSRPSEKDPIKMFNFDDEKNEVTLPYTFYRAITSSEPNIHKKFPEVIYNFKGSLYENQQPVADEALSQLNTYGTTTLNLYTAFGKTVVAAYLASKLKMLTLVLYTSTVLGPQWRGAFEEFTDAGIWMVGEDKEFPEGGAHVILCMDTRFSQLPQEYVDQIGVVIYDEVHLFCAPTRARCFLGIQPRYIIAASATVNREDGMHDVVHAVCGMHSVVKISKKPFNVFKYMTGINIPMPKNIRGQTDWSKYCENLCGNE